MALIKNPYCKRDFVYTCPGERYRIEYVKCFDDKGAPYLKEDGKTDLQALYDSQRDSTDFSLIVQSMINNGINPFNAKINYDEEVEDYTSFTGKDSTDIMMASMNYKANQSKIAEYEAKMKALQAENDKIKKELPGGDPNPQSQEDNK